MSKSVSEESRVQDVIDAARGPNKCRIPMRLPPGRNRPPFNNMTKPKGEPAKQKFDVIQTQHNRFAAKTTSRPRSDEQSRPKSANRLKDDHFTGRFTHTPARIIRNERFSANLKRPSTLPKLSINETVVPNKTGRPYIMVPITQRGKNVHTIKNVHDLPDQETIKKCEDLELRQSEISDATQGFNDFYERESLTTRSEQVMQLKISWQEKMVIFEKMKNELTDRQKAIMELYAKLYKTHNKMTSLGEKAILPPAEELCIMNVNKMTPEQLLQMCAENVCLGDTPTSPVSAHVTNNNALAIDVQKLYNMPSKLVDTCEQTLLKRKEIIDWFDFLKSQDKGISFNKLSKKINEFNAENDMLKSSLEQVKAEFVKEFEEIVSFVRKSVNNTMNLQLRHEELVYELSEMKSQNADLRKQVHNVENLRSHTNKNRVEELQKELKEERCKRIFLRDRLSRAEGQVKMNQEIVTQLEATLEQAHAQIRTLERTVQQLHEQNKHLQSEFDKELAPLTESIKEHTLHLEEIAEAREKLQAEKIDLEKRLAELAKNYNESLENIKHEMNVNVVKLIETEKKYEKEAEDKTKLESKVESLCAQLLEAQLRLKDATKLIQENKSEIDSVMNIKQNLEATNQELCETRLELIDYKNGMTKQNEVIIDIERSYKESLSSHQTLKCDLSTKEEYIAELEKKQSLLEQQLQENESKMEAYVEQLTSLKTHITQLQEDFGEFENLSELHDKVNSQRAQLLEATRQNGELAQTLQRKEQELEQLSTALAEQESNIEQREGVIKIISEKEEEQTNIIKILRNNLELRSQADNNFNQLIAEKNLEIDTLLMDVDNSKQQMSNLEKIIITLQEQTRKASIQRKKDEDKITMLQSKIAEYEAFRVETSRIIDAPAENLDNLIKIIEDELGSPIRPPINKEHEYATQKKKYHEDRKRDKHEFQEELNNVTLYKTETGNYPPKMLISNYVKKAYVPTNEKQYEGDNLDRKRAITSIDTQKWLTSTPNSLATRDLPNPEGTIPDENLKPYLGRHMQYYNTSPNQFRDDRKYKMYKLAGHRL